MIKQLLSVAVVAAISFGTAFAQQTVFIGETGYDNLAAAVSAVQDGQTITITGEQVFTGGRITVDRAVNFTIKGEGETAKFTRGSGNKTNLFLLLKQCTVNFDNITFDGANVDGVTNKMVEVNTGANVTFNNCEFANCTNTAIQVKNTTTLNNVSSSTNNLPENKGLVFVGKDNAATFSGTANYSVEIEKQYHIIAGENISGKVELILTGEYKNELLVVANSVDTEVFSLANAAENFFLMAKDGNLVLGKNVVKNETTGVLYTSLSEAMGAASVKDVLVVLENLDVADRLNNAKDGNRNLTIKGANPDNKIVLKRTFKNKLFVTTNGHFTFENIVFDCNNMENNTYELQASQGNLNLHNVEIINSVSTKGLAEIKGGRVLLLDNVTKSNCTSTTPDVALSGKLELNGNNNLSVNVTNTDAGVITAKGELTNTDPIELTLPVETALGSIVVNGTTAYQKFILTNADRYLKAENGNLVLSDKKATGIEDVTVADEDAPAEYYNLSGMRVNGENLTPGIYVKRQGGKATKVYVK